MINILDIPQKTSINRSLQSKSIMVVGKSKSGKSTLAAQAPKPIFLMTENGGEMLVGFTPVPISSWADFKNAVNQLCTTGAREKFSTVVIDTYTNLILLLDKYIGQKLTTDKNSYDFASDVDYGKGSRAMRNELGIQLQKLANQGYLILNIVHAEDKTDFDTGKNYIGTSLSNSLYGVAEKFVDQIVYLRKDEDKKTGNVEHRIWFNAKGGFGGAGGRLTPAVDSVPCSYTELESALLDAMDTVGEKTGASMTIESKPSVQIDIKEPSDYVLKDQKEKFDALVQSIITEDKENIGKVQSIIAAVLGPNKKVANLVDGQEELLAEILTILETEFNK